VPDALYERDGDLLLPTALTRGPWSREHQHAGPPSALLSRAVDAVAAIGGAHTARIAIDILRPVPLEPLRTEARIVRPGRNVELVEATLLLAADDTPLMRAGAWRIRREAIDLPPELAEPDPPPPGPDGLETSPKPRFFEDDDAYHAALEWRFFHGTFDGPGPAGCWTRMRVPLVAGEPSTPVEHLLVMGDAASGISATLDWADHLFINVDLTVHLERPPEGEWLAMDAVTRPRAQGSGTATSVLSDRRGRVGSTAQALLLAPR
jgi:hypothetical protein